MSARGMWDAAKHPRGARGRFGIKVTGSTSRSEARDALTDMRRKRMSPGEATTKLFANPKGKHATSVLKWEPGVYGGRDARIKYRYGKGRYGPSTGGRRRLVEPAGWKVVGHKAMPSGSTFAALAKRKKRRG
jgi:hypothetical protein